MNPLLQIQFKKVYGEKTNINLQSEKIRQFISLIDDTYKSFEEEQLVLKNILDAKTKELKATSKLMQEHKELLKSVENSMDDAIFYKNLKHEYIGCNKKFEEFMGISEKELIGQTDKDFFDAQTIKKHYEVNEDIIKYKTHLIYKHWVDFEDEKIYVLTSKTPLINSKGEVKGIVGISRDITYEYELQQNIQQKNIMLIQQNKLISMGEMIANIAHQWRQPLNTLGLIIQKMAAYYKQGLLDKKEIDTNVTEAMSLMQGMSETIDDFRDFFSSTRTLEDFSVQKVVDKVLVILKPLLASNKIELIFNVEKKYFISGYKNEFFQVILNIINNAIEALLIDRIIVPKINISITDEAEKIILKICDNANGVKNSNINKIFDPYFTTKEKGTGLGLYMSKIIIEEHMNGQIIVDSNKIGTTFTIILQGVGMEVVKIKQDY